VIREDLRELEEQMRREVVGETVTGKRIHRLAPPERDHDLPVVDLVLQLEDRGLDRDHLQGEELEPHRGIT